MFRRTADETHNDTQNDTHFPRHDAQQWLGRWLLNVGILTGTLAGASLLGQPPIPESAIALSNTESKLTESRAPQPLANTTITPSPCGDELPFVHSIQDYCQQPSEHGSPLRGDDIAEISPSPHIAQTPSRQFDARHTPFSSSSVVQTSKKSDISFPVIAESASTDTHVIAGTSVEQPSPIDSSATEGPEPDLPNHQNSDSSEFDKTNRPPESNSALPSETLFSPPEGLELSLQEVIYLALENNIEIKNAYLDRVGDRADLAAAEAEFSPQLTPTLQLTVNPLAENRIGPSNRLDGDIDAVMTLRLPTGGEIEAGWFGDLRAFRTGNFPNLRDEADQEFGISMRQPLLRGAGIQLATANLEIARLNERINQQALRNTLINEITGVIVTYRNLLQAQEDVAIQQRSLESAQTSREITQALIDAGRLAPVEIVNDDADIARRRVSLLGAQNNLAAQQLDLLGALDLPPERRVRAAALPNITAPELDRSALQQLALSQRPDYRQQQLQTNIDQLTVDLAADARRWDLSLTGSVTESSDALADTTLGLSLSKTLGDASLEQRLRRAEVSLQQTQNRLQQFELQLDRDVRNQIREVTLAFDRLQLARDATTLAQRLLEIEQEKRRLGRDVRLIDLIGFQNGLADARSAELSAAIAYLNNLTELDRTLGTTLNTWNITLSPTNHDSPTR